jgi:hypothetical protein
MQQEFQHLLDYCKANKLAVNFRKSRYVVISSQLKKSNITAPNIEQKDYIKYLGIYIDKNLNWKPEMLHINKISKHLGMSTN